MIARMWHGKVPGERTERYHRYLIETGLKDYDSIEGNKGVYLLKRDEGDITHFYTLTFWANLESIKRFAGEEYTRSKYYPEDKDYLLELEPSVIHFDVLEMPDYLLKQLNHES